MQDISQASNILCLGESYNIKTLEHVMNPNDPNSRQGLDPLHFVFSAFLPLLSFWDNSWGSSILLLLQSDGGNNITPIFFLPIRTISLVIVLLMAWCQSGPARISGDAFLAAWRAYREKEREVVMVGHLGNRIMVPVVPTGMMLFLMMLKLVLNMLGTWF